MAQLDGGQFALLTHVNVAAGLARAVDLPHAPESTLEALYPVGRVKEGARPALPPYLRQEMCAGDEINRAQVMKFLL